jgi:hypothetical protein
MIFSGIYDSEALQLLSSALSDSFGELQKLSGPFSEERSDTLKRMLAARLMKAYDEGIREPPALKQAALSGFSFVDK